MYTHTHIDLTVSAVKPVIPLFYCFVHWHSGPTNSFWLHHPSCPTLLGSSIFSSACVSVSCRGRLARWPLSSDSTSCPSSDARFDVVGTEKRPDNKL